MWILELKVTHSQIQTIFVGLMNVNEQHMVRNNWIRSGDLTEGDENQIR